MSRPDGEAGVTPAVLYGAKSTEDPRGSIATQLADCRAAAVREGREVVAVYSDEAASAFTSSRGGELVLACEHAERLAAEHGACELWIQHSDRLARGDGRVAKHLVEYTLWAGRAGVKLRSVQDDTTFSDILHSALMGQRNHEDSPQERGGAVGATAQL